MFATVTVVAVATYGFLKNFSPDYQYFSDYLTGHKNFTRDEVTQEIYPVVTYSNFILSLVILLVIDLVQYKPVIVFGALSLICAKAMLYFGTTVLHMQLAEMFYAISKASNLGYTTYIYTQIDKGKYQMATSIIHISPKLGLISSSLIGQFLLLYQLAELEDLLEINLVVCCLALLVSLYFPSANHRVAIGNLSVCSKKEQEISDPTFKKLVERTKLQWKEFKSTFTNPYLLKWCIWLAISCGSIELVLHYYAQALWSEVSGSKENIYNGTAEMTYIVFSMIGCYIAGKVNIKWNDKMDVILGVLTVLKGFFIVFSSRSETLCWAYLYYVVYVVMYDVMLVLCRAEMAQHLENFGLIFGIVQFFANMLQCTLTYVLTSPQGLALSIRDQFSVTGWSVVVVGAVFMLNGFGNLFKSSGSLAINNRK